MHFFKVGLPAANKHRGEEQQRQKCCCHVHDVELLQLCRATRCRQEPHVVDNTSVTCNLISFRIGHVQQVIISYWYWQKKLSPIENSIKNVKEAIFFYLLSKQMYTFSSANLESSVSLVLQSRSHFFFLFIIQCLSKLVSRHISYQVNCMSEPNVPLKITFTFLRYGIKGLYKVIALMHHQSNL